MMQKFKNLFHLLQAVGVYIYYGAPWKKLKVVGVTGTDGKTTTTHLIYHILKHAGKKASMISSIYAVVGAEVFETGLHITTPSALDIQKYLQLSHKSGDEFFILETTSHAIDQYRVWGITFHVTLLTNITHEHLDYHKDFDAYLRTKSKLLLASGISLVNRDDMSFEKVRAYLNRHNHPFKTYSLHDKADHQYPKEVHTQLVGVMNKYNILAAYALCQELGIDRDVILSAIVSFASPKGRMDRIYDGAFVCVIDFAHTEAAITQALQSVKQQFAHEKADRIIHIFGCAGERDRLKRPLMGQASARYSSIIILTEEDYRSENLDDIFHSIEKGVLKAGFKKIRVEELLQNPLVKHVYVTVADRQEAIELGIQIAQKDDVVIATGKGHEQSLCRGKKEYPWNEYDVFHHVLIRRGLL